MENKVRFDGVILNEPKLTEFNSTLIRIQNKQEFTKKDGTQGSSSCTIVVTAMGSVAEEAVKRFKRGQIIRVEGSLQLKKSKNMDQEGREIYETWIKARTINALPNGGSIQPNMVPLEKGGKGTPSYSPIGYQKVQQRGPQAPVDKNVFEEVFNDDLPF